MLTPKEKLVATAPTPTGASTGSVTETPRGSAHFTAWDEPKGYREGISMRTLRKLVKAMPKKWREAELSGQACQDVYDKISMCGRSAESQSECWNSLHGLLESLGFAWSVAHRLRLAEFAKKDSSAARFPPNLIDLTKIPGKAYPPEEDEWWYYPLNWAPPTPPTEDRTNLAKSVPEWDSGYMVSWHGTSFYGLCTALYCGFLAPSERDVEGNATACGRGVYTTFQFMGAARHAVPMLWDPELSHCVKAVLLVAIPGESEAGVCRWIKDASKAKGNKYILESNSGGDNSWRLHRDEARAKSDRLEPDWTNVAEDHDQETSSRAYPLGFALCRVFPEALKKYKYEGQKRRLNKGFNVDLLPPPARPPRNREPEQAARTSQAHHGGQAKKRKSSKAPAAQR